MARGVFVWIALLSDSPQVVRLTLPGLAGPTRSTVFYCCSIPSCPSFSERITAATPPRLCHIVPFFLRDDFLSPYERNHILCIPVSPLMIVSKWPSPFTCRCHLYHFPSGLPLSLLGLPRRLYLIHRRVCSRGEVSGS